MSLSRQLRFALAALSLQFGVVTAHAFEFSNYFCDYANWGTGWTQIAIGWTTYSNQLGWYETTLVAKSKVMGPNGGELGICSYVSASDPQTLSLNILFVDGKNLSMVANKTCIYSGEPVKYTEHIMPLTQPDSHLAQFHSGVFDGQKIDFLHIAGIRTPSDQNPKALCLEALKEAAGQTEINPDSRLQNYLTHPSAVQR